MKATAQRMESTDLEWVASAVDINRETGGNLAEVLENVTGTIRGRYRLRRQIKHAHRRGSHVGEGPDRLCRSRSSSGARCSTAASVT